MTWSTRMPAGVPETGPHRLDERPVAGRAQPVRHERRQAPVLPVEREVVGRRPHRDALGQHVLPRPGVGALAVEADGEVGHQPERAPGPGQLLVEQPLEPGVERDAARVARRRSARPPATRDAGAPPASAASPRRDARPARRRWRTRRGPAPPGRGSGRARGVIAGSRARPQRVERRHLEPEHGVAVDPALGREGTPLGRQPLDVEPRAPPRRAPPRPGGRADSGSGGSRESTGSAPAARTEAGREADSGRPRPPPARSRTTRRAAGGPRDRRSPSCPATGARRAGRPSPTSGAPPGGGTRGGATTSRRAGRPSSGRSSW